MRSSLSSSDSVTTGPLHRNMQDTHISWVRDESVEDSANLPTPDAIAQEIVEDLLSTLEQFEEIGADLGMKDR